MNRIEEFSDFTRELNRLFFEGWEAIGIVDPEIADIFEDDVDVEPDDVVE